MWAIERSSASSSQIARDSKVGDGVANKKGKKGEWAMRTIGGRLDEPLPTPKSPYTAPPVSRRREQVLSPKSPAAAIIVSVEDEPVDNKMAAISQTISPSDDDNTGKRRVRRGSLTQVFLDIFGQRKVRVEKVKIWSFKKRIPR